MKVTVNITVDQWSYYALMYGFNALPNLLKTKATWLSKRAFQHIRERMEATNYGIVSDHWP